MKIRTNFDLIEESILAKKGFSLKKITKDSTQSIISSALTCSSFFIIGGVPIRTAEEIFYKSIPFCVAIDAILNVILINDKKANARERLINLSRQLGDIYFDTDADMLTDARKYKTEFKLKFETFPPKLEEHKYIMVPVHNDWGNNERSLHQEHVIGTRDYDYSYGEPEKQKQYSYQMKRVINK